MCSVHSNQVEGNKYSHETKSPAHDQAELVEGDAAIPEVNLRDCQSPRQPNSMTRTRVAINKAQRGGCLLVSSSEVELHTGQPILAGRERRLQG